MVKTIKKRAGFTIIELIMATAVFSMVLLLGLTGFIQVGRMFYKGVTMAQTRDAARDTLDLVTNDIKLASSVGTVQNAGGLTYLCIGNHRYSINQFNKVTTLNDGASSTNFGLKRDTLPGGSCDNTSVPLASQSGSTELLGNRMRLLRFEVLPVTGSPNLYTVNVKIAYGEDGELNNPNTVGATCRSSSVGTQFCSVIELNTQVYRGL